MDDLIAFLRACLDEDERVARAAEGTEMGPWLDVFEAALNQADQPEDVRRAVGRHIAHFTPGRMLWDIAAKRRNLEHNQKLLQRAEPLAAEAGEHGLRLLAVGFAGRKGYRPEFAAGGI